MNLVSVLLAASLCVISGVRAADLTTNQAYHDVCDSHCAIEDFTNVAMKFSRQITVKKARVVNLTTRTYSKNDLCQSTSLLDFSLIWAVDEKEPYLYLPPGFLDFSGLFSLQFRQRMDIRLNCTRKVRRAPLDEPNGTSLLDTVMRSLTQDLMKTSGGTLCFPQESQDNTDKSYKCCLFDKSTSEMMCNVVHSKFVHWFQMLHSFWKYVAIIILLYLPAVVCLFPALPKVSEDGIRCIELGDPSPAGFRSLVVKAFVSQNTASLHKTRIFLLKVVLIACICFPLMVTPFLNLFGASYGRLNTFFFAGPGLYIAYVIKSFISAFFPSQRESECLLCKIAFLESTIHSDTGDAVKKHMSAQLSICMIACRRFTLRYFNLFKSHAYISPHFESPMYAVWSVCCIFYFVAVFLFAIPGFIVGWTCIFCASFVCSSPLVTCIFLSDLSRSGFVSFGIVSHMKLFFVLLLSHLALYIWVFVYSAAFVGNLLLNLIMTVIDYGDIVFPFMALSFLVLYYLHSCFTSFSEKYQLLKIKLYQGIRQHHMSKESDEGEDSLLVYTKSKAIAIPEDLYKAAREELRMPMMANFWVAFMRMVCLLIFALSVFGSIIIFGARSGIAPLTKAVAIFLAGSFPKLFSVFSTGESERTLQEFDMEMRLKTVITRYAQGQFRRDDNGETTNGGMDNTETVTEAFPQVTIWQHLPMSRARDAVTDE